MESVYGQMGKFIHKDWKVEDHGIAALRFENEIIATVESTSTGQFGSPVRVIITATKGEAKIIRVVQGKKVNI